MRLVQQDDQRRFAATRAQHLRQQPAARRRRCRQFHAGAYPANVELQSRKPSTQVRPLSGWRQRLEQSRHRGRLTGGDPEHLHARGSRADLAPEPGQQRGFAIASRSVQNNEIGRRTAPLHLAHASGQHGLLFFAPRQVRGRTARAGLEYHFAPGGRRFEFPRHGCKFSC